MENEPLTNLPAQPEKSQKSPWPWASAAIVIVLAILSYAIWWNDDVAAPVSTKTTTETPLNQPTPSQQIEVTLPSANVETNVAPTSPAVKTFNIEGGMFYFNPKEISVNKGDKVKIVFTNKEGFHDFKLNEFNVGTPQIKAGESATVEFTADKTGTYEYYCSVGSHRAQGIKGQLIVK